MSKAVNQLSTDTAGDEVALRWVTVNEASAVPPYEQIRLQLAEAAHSGRLVVGTKLPSVRALAALLGLAVNTVARAYRELEQAGIVQTRSRAGTVVAAGTDQARTRLAQAAGDYADVVRSQGVSTAEAVALLHAALQSRGQ